MSKHYNDDELEKVASSNGTVEQFTTIGQLQFKHVRDLDSSKGKTVRSAELSAALDGGKTNTSGMAAYIMYWAIFVSFLCSCTNGYDGSLMNAINGMESYQNRFESGRLGATTGLIFAIYSAGNMAGALFAGPLTDIRGRRVGMFVGAILICVGSIIATTSKHKPQFIAGRFFLGFGVAFVTTAAPAYCIEISPPAWRGRATGFYNCGWFGGSIPAAAITYGCAFLNTNAGWQVPLALQCLPAFVVCCSVLFLPESPRWLLAQNREEEARNFLIKYHGNGDPKSTIVALEMEEFKHDIATDGSDQRFWDLSGLFGTKNARWRLLMVIMMGVFGQFSGNGLGYFNLDIYKSLGYGYSMQFGLNLVNSIVQAICAASGVMIADRAPRRPILVAGTLASAAFLAINAGLSTQWAKEPAVNPNLNVGRGAVAAYFLFWAVYSFSYSPLQALYPSECLQTNARAKGMATNAFVVSAVGFINQYATPIGLKNIKYNFIWIFVGWDCIEALLWFLFAVETQGRTLEELDEIFGAKNPVKASLAMKKVVIEGDQVLVAEA